MCTGTPLSHSLDSLSDRCECCKEIKTTHFHILVLTFIVVLHHFLHVSLDHWPSSSAKVVFKSSMASSLALMNLPLAMYQVGDLQDGLFVSVHVGIVLLPLLMDDESVRGLVTLGSLSIER